jgi:aspartyl-tRNA(Asn)/glutamyl-tRNA(Gln) amidotransferase subunit A
MARTVADAAAMLDVLAGHDPLDPCSSDRRCGGYSAGLSTDGLAGKRVGVPTNYYFDLIDPEVETLVRAAISRLELQGATVVDVRLPDLEEMVGVRVALGAEGLAFADPFLRTVPEQFSDELRRTMLALYFVPARDLARANRVRRLLQQRFAATFAQVDLLATPSTCVAAFPIEAPTVRSRDRRSGHDVEVPASRSLIRATWPTNLTGNPAVSVPAGFSADGLPVGLQLTARPFEEALLLSAAYAFEQATTWSTRRPPV